MLNIPFELKEYSDKLNEINQSYEIYKSEFLSGEKNYKEEELIIKSLMLLDEIYHNIF